LLTGGGRFAAAIRRRLSRDGYRIVADGEAGDVDAIVIDVTGPNSGASFLAVTDEVFTDRLEDFLDLFDVLRAGLSRLREGGAVVVLTTRGYLGAWGGVEEMAFSGAVVGVMRSISLEATPRGLRANVVAADFAPGDFGADGRLPPDQDDRVAGAVAFLLGDDALAISGEVLLVNSGRGLQRREARDRRHQLDARVATAPRLHERTPTDEFDPT